MTSTASSSMLRCQHSDFASRSSKGLNAAKGCRTTLQTQGLHCASLRTESTSSLTSALAGLPPRSFVNNQASRRSNTSLAAIAMVTRKAVVEEEEEAVPQWIERSASFMNAELGMSREEAVQWWRNQGTLMRWDWRREGFALEQGLRSRVELLKGECSCTKEQVRDFMQNARGYFFWAPIDNQREIARLLREYGVENVGKVVSSTPTVLTENVSRIQRVLGFHARTLQMSKEDLGKLIEKHPRQLSNQIENMQETINLLVGRLSVSPAQVGELLVKAPRLFSSSKDDIAKTLDFMQSHGLSRTQVAELVLKDRRLLGYSADRLKRTAKHLAAEGFNVNEMWADGVVSVWSAPPEMIPIRMKFLREELKMGVEDVLGRPAYLSYSITERTGPRTAFLKNKGLLITSLGAAFGTTDRMFVNRYGIPMTEFRLYAERWQSLEGRNWVEAERVGKERERTLSK